MANPWDIYSVLWQNGTFITSQKLQENSKTHSNIRYFSFLNSSLCHQWGIHEIKIDTSQLHNGLIIIESLQCTFPNGEPFVYANNWQKINGDQYIADSNNKIYSIEINCADYSSLFTNKNSVEIGLSMNMDSFSQNIFFPIITAVRDVASGDDINEVPRQFPIVSLLPREIRGNLDNNFIPLMQITTKNGIYKTLDYQHPIVLLKANSMIFSFLQEFIQRLYARLSYIQQENNTPSRKQETDSFLQALMGNIFLLNSLLKNENSPIDEVYYFFLKLLGDLECFGNFDFSHYPYMHRDLLGTFKKITNRITVIVENFYEIGEFLYFTMADPDTSIYSDGSLNAIYVLNVEMEKLKDKEVYLDIKATDMEKMELERWIENSIICGDQELQKNKIEKKRGINRELLSFKVQEKQNSNLLLLRYKLDFSQLAGENNIIIFNPIILKNISLMLIKK